MRSDFHKVITERPRVGGNVEDKKTWERVLLRRVRGFRPAEDADEEDPYGELHDERPVRQGIRRPYFRDRKEFSDHIEPLRRYLRSQVGRPWNDVWSDICKVLRGNGLQANHVKDHVRGFVGGVPFSGDKYFYGEIGEPRYSYYHESLYVDREGILRIQLPPPRKKARSEEQRVRRRKRNK